MSMTPIASNTMAPTINADTFTQRGMPGGDSLSDVTPLSSPASGGKAAIHMSSAARRQRLADAGNAPGIDAYGLVCMRVPVRVRHESRPAGIGAKVKRSPVVLRGPRGPLRVDRHSADRILRARHAVPPCLSLMPGWLD